MPNAEIETTLFQKPAQLLARLPNIIPPNLYPDRNKVMRWALTARDIGRFIPSPGLSKIIPLTSLFHGTPALEDFQVVSKVSTYNIRQTLKLLPRIESSFPRYYETVARYTCRVTKLEVTPIQ
jgi:hypothetical protein